ncbi:hypothetical protein ScPMuIL_005035 [Solemya velum]
MSRANVSKSRADKGGKPPASQTPIVAHEIVPGKFTDHDWSSMVDHDGADEFVTDIVDEIIGSAMDKIYQCYIQRQLIPFTVCTAKEAILQIVEWQFLSRDEGEQNFENDTTWMEDQEPEPVKTDCWAQGSVPKSFIPIPAIEEKEELEEPAEGAEVPEEDKVEEQGEQELEDRVSETAEVTKEDISEESKKKRKIKFKPYSGRIKSGGLSKLAESLDQTEMSMVYTEIEESLDEKLTEKISGFLSMPLSCHSIVKAQTGRPPGNKDVLYDDLGNVVSVMKLNPDRLPTHRVKVRYQVVDPHVEAAEARLEAMRTGRYIGRKQFNRIVKKDEKVTHEESTQSGARNTRAPLPPPLVDLMEVSAGVTVKEGGRMRRGPARYVRKVDVLAESQNSLRPVASRPLAPTLNVADLLDRHTPILRPMRESPPLPPIIPQTPTKYNIST